MRVIRGVGACGALAPFKKISSVKTVRPLSDLYTVFATTEPTCIKKEIFSLVLSQLEYATLIF